VRGLAVDIDGRCVLFRLRGECPAGLKCRFLKDHYDPETKTLTVNEEVKAEYLKNPSSITYSIDREVPFSLAYALLGERRDAKLGEFRERERESSERERESTCVWV
jgi:hypothetical protein